MKKIDTSQRSREPEIMDDFDLLGKELERTLQDIDVVNKWLGGNKLTISGIKKLLREHPGNELFHIADIGCGNGAMLRKVASWGREEGYRLKFTGIDANLHAIEIAEKLSTDYPEIQYSPVNIFSKEFERSEFDIILCTLTLHHFKDPDIIKLLRTAYANARIGIVINDLHRSKIAYFLFKAFSRLFIKNEIAKKDGLISILRGFKKQDLQVFSKHIPSGQQEIQWKWAFRYRWIIAKK